MEREISNYAARTHWSEVLQDVKNGQHFVITHRGEPIAQLLPIESDADSKQQRSMHAAELLLQLMNTRKPVEIDIRALIDEGRD